MKDPNDTRDIGPRVGSPLWTYLTVVTVSGAILFALAMTWLPRLAPLSSTLNCARAPGARGTPGPSRPAPPTTAC